MRWMLRLRDGDSERGSGIQERTRTGLEGAQMRRETEHKALLPQVQALYTRATQADVHAYGMNASLSGAAPVTVKL